MKYQEMTLKEFISRLGSGAPVPGGGGASALCGCLGIALGDMVAHLTIGRARYQDVQEEMEQAAEKAQTLQKELLELIDLDAEMFLPLSRAYSMPRETDEEKAAREQVMKDALSDACKVPLQIMEKTCQALDLIRILAKSGSKGAVSDAGDAAVLCSAALQGAALNVFINTKSMKDRELAREYNTRADTMLKKYVPAAQEIYAQVLAQLQAAKDS